MVTIVNLNRSCARNLPHVLTLSNAREKHSICFQARVALRGSSWRTRAARRVPSTRSARRQGPPPAPRVPRERLPPPRGRRPAPTAVSSGVMSACVYPALSVLGVINVILVYSWCVHPGSGPKSAPGAEVEQAGCTDGSDWV